MERTFEAGHSQEEKDILDFVKLHGIASIEKDEKVSEQLLKITRSYHKLVDNSMTAAQLQAELKKGIQDFLKEDQEKLYTKLDLVSGKVERVGEMVTFQGDRVVAALAKLSGPQKEIEIQDKVRV